VQPRVQVEQLPRLDASELVWTGLLDRAWRDGVGEPEPWPCAQLAEGFAAAYSDRRMATLLRPVSTTPCPVGPDSIAIEIELEVRESWLLGPDVQRVEQRLELVATAAPFGGARWWFRCGACGSRRASMDPSFLGGQWACRVCWGLTYRSRAQYGHPWGRGRGCHSAISYAMDRLEAEDRQRARATYRRQVSRSRARWRGDPTSASTWPVALTCRSSVRGDGAR
jgi:hypothetical protein